MRSVLVLTFVLFISGNGLAQPVNTAGIDSFFNTVAGHDQMMGSVAIAKSGRVIYRRSLGSSAIGARQNVPANDTTCYRIGSVTKMFTATMIFQLIEAGKLSLSTPLSRYFPDIPNAGEITIALLLNHRSGLYDFVNDYGGMRWLAAPHSTDEILKVIARRKHHARPDAGLKYSNSAYFLLAKIIEQVTHQSYDANLQSRICAPLGLRHTYSSRDNRPRENAAIPYSFSGGKWDEIKDMWFPNVAGVGDIESTPVDLVVFADGLLAGRLINAVSLQSMTTIIDPPFGMGIMRLPFLEHTGYGHGGDTYGSHAFVAHFPADSLTVATCINGESFSRYGINAGILGSCFNEGRVIPDWDQSPPDTIALSSYAGRYSTRSLPQKVAITLKGARLFAQPEGRPASELIAAAPGIFFFKQGGFFIRFRPDKGEMLMNHGAGTLLYKRAD